MDWINLVQDTEKWRALLDKMQLTRCVIIRVSRSTALYGVGYFVILPTLRSTRSFGHSSTSDCTLTL